jgi:hypothetical protein
MKMTAFFLRCSVLLLVLSAFAGCKKDKEVTPDVTDSLPATSPTLPGAGSATLNFSNMAGSNALLLSSSGYYLTANNDSLSVDIYKYYVSNFQLVKEDGSLHPFPESYFLIDAGKPSSLTPVLNNIPPGNYTGIRFLLGVDSTRNVSGAQTGALDPANGMFWTWSTGYIMAKLEGSSPQSGAGNKSVVLHIGGFSGKNSALKNIELLFPSKVTINDKSKPIITIKSDILEWFKSPDIIDLADIYNTMLPGSSSKSIAANYADMFSLVGVSY